MQNHFLSVEYNLYNSHCLYSFDLSDIQQKAKSVFSHNNNMEEKILRVEPLANRKKSNDYNE